MTCEQESQLCPKDDRSENQEVYRQPGPLDLTDCSRGIGQGEPQGESTYKLDQESGLTVEKAGSIILIPNANMFGSVREA